MTSTSEVDAIRAAIEARWSGLSDLGTYNCRKKRGKYTSGSSWSQHAWGNAWDVAASPATLDEIEAWLPRSGLPVGTVLRYDDHLHVEGQTTRTGTPPCAGGPPDDDSDQASVDQALLPMLPPAGTGPIQNELFGGGSGSIGQLATAARWLTDPTNWTRIGLGLAGVLVIVLAVVLLMRDLAPTTAVRAVAGAAS